MSTSYVNAAGLRLRVARTGEGRPLLLITGIGANLDMWAPLERLVTDRELIAFDAPGVGLSQRPRAPLRMPQLARIVRELMDVLALERADVLGYSFGGALAQELARRAPDRVRRLVLCATGPGLGGVPPRPMAALMLATPARYYHPRLLALSVPRIAGGRTAREPSVLAEHAGARLAGDDDPSVPVLNARMLAARLPDARLHVIKGGGHLFLLDEPQSAVGRILGFLDERT